MKPPLTVAKAPCISCPYRLDVPSGVWAASEYDKLPAYDAPPVVQVTNGALARFDCHQQNGKLCAGWVGCHGADNLMALRVAGFSREIAEEVWAYESPVPLFLSGAEAAAHGKRQIDRPGRAARAMIGRLKNKLKGKIHDG